jgi:hypothetical protein
MGQSSSSISAVHPTFKHATQQQNNREESSTTNNPTCLQKAVLVAYQNWSSSKTNMNKWLTFMKEGRQNPDDCKRRRQRKAQNNSGKQEA